MRVVVALGGNAIGDRGSSLEAKDQEERVREAVSALADIARGHDVVVTHGNGPQVGMLELQARSDPSVAPYSLDLLGAETDGMLGYLLERELHSLFPSSQIATLLTQVEVDAADPAFKKPTKPIGPPLDAERAAVLEAQLGWQFLREEAGLRRVVASPEPRRILELTTVELLVDAGVLVVCGGGGGIPVVRGPSGGLQGVDAVVDKDRTAALLARELSADALLLLTDVDAVYADWPDPARQAIRLAPVEVARALDLAPGSMGPKVEAACRFAEGGGFAAIGAWGAARKVMQGSAGTRITADGSGLELWSQDPTR